MMSNYTLTVPDEIYVRARKIAEDTAQPVEQVLVEHLRTLTLPQPRLAVDEETELAALKHLSDDTLWTIAREYMPDQVQARMQILMEANSRGTIVPDEFDELTALTERGQRLTLRKSEAAALLTQRGYTVTAKDLSRRE
jgi:hypothetical protein